MLYLSTLLHISFVSNLSLLETAVILVYTTTFSVVPRYIHLLVSYQDYYCSALHNHMVTTMASADFLWQALLHDSSCP